MEFVTVDTDERLSLRLANAFIPPLGHLDSADVTFLAAGGTEVFDERQGRQRLTTASALQVGQEVHADVEELYYPDIVPEFFAVRIFIVGAMPDP